MKKLLALLGTVTIGATSPITVLYATTSIPKMDSTHVANASEQVANALIEKQQDNLNSQSYLNYAKDNDPNKWNNSYDSKNPNLSLSQGLNLTFGQNSDLSKMINGASAIKDTDSTLSGLSTDPTMSKIATIFNALGLDKGKLWQQDPSYISDLLYVADLPKILGQVLGGILGSTNPLVKAITSMPIESLTSAINNFNTEYSDKSYAIYDKTSDSDSLGVTASTDSAFGYAEFGDGDNKEGLVAAIATIIAGKPSSIDYEQIASFALLLINYMSQFNISTNVADNSAISDHMYDSKKTNEEYRTEIDKTKVGKMNFNNLQSLTTNLLSFTQDSNTNGIGFSQIIDLLFGSENTIGVSDNSNQADIADLKFVPDTNYYNPITSFLQAFMPVAIESDPTLLNLSPAMTRLIAKTHIIEQGISLIGGLLDNIATNQTIDNQLNIISGLVNNASTVIDTFGLSIPNLKSYINIYMQTDTDLRANPGWISADDNFIPLKANGAYTIPVIKKDGTTWSDLYTYKVGSKNPLAVDFSNIINTALKVTGSKLPKLPFINLRTMLIALTSVEKVPGTSLSINQMLNDLDDKNGLLGTIINNLPAISKMMSDILNSIESSTITVNNKVENTNTAAQNWIKTNVDATLDKTGQIAKIQKSNPNLLDNLSIMSIAMKEDAFTAAFKSQKSYVTIAEDTWFNYIGYDVNTGDTTSGSNKSIYSILKTNWTTIVQLVLAAGYTINQINNDIEKPFKTAYDSAVKAGITDVSKPDSKTGNITYNIKNKTNTYNVTLYYDKNHNDYTIGVNKKS